MKKPFKSSPYLIYLPLFFCLLLLIRSGIRSYRNHNEIAPIRNGLIEKYKREQGSLIADTGRIYLYSNSKDGKVRYGSRIDSNMKIKKGDYLLRLRTESQSFSFSRDTTVGQIVCVIYDDKNPYDWPNKMKIIGIYFKPGTDRILYNNYNLTMAALDLRDTKANGYFVAETFSKDFNSAGSILTRKRIETIAKELKAAGVDVSQFSLSEF